VAQLLPPPPPEQQATAPPAPAWDAQLPPMQPLIHVDLTTQPNTMELSPQDARFVQLLHATVAPLKPPERDLSHSRSLEDAFPEHMGPISGIELTNLLSWCGLSSSTHLPPFWKAFVETKCNNSCTFVLQSYLTQAQCHNPHVQFSICPETIALQFDFPSTVQYLTKGITIFTAQLQDQEHINEMVAREEAQERATHVDVEDILKHNAKAQYKVPFELHGFLELLATFWALVHTILGSSSPLFLNADMLYNHCLAGHHAGNLNAIRINQPDWFGHVLWQIYVGTRTYFSIGPMAR